MKYLSLLTATGLGDKQARCYLTLLELGELTVTELAKNSGIKRTSIYNFIEELQVRGLVSRIARSRRWYYRAEPPEKLFHSFLAQVNTFEQALPLLARAYDNKNLKPSVTYLEGAKQVRHIIKEELSCKKHAYYVWPARDVVSMVGGVKYLANLDRIRINKNIWVHSIHFRNKRVSFETSGIGPRYCREVRYAPASLDIKMGVGIYDSGKVGFFSSSGEGFGVLIKSNELYQLMKILFDFMWQHCSKIE